MLTLEEVTSTEKRMRSILKHIQHVRENCESLGEHLIEIGEPDFGRTLIANGLIHDNSKLYGIEWEYLNDIAKKENPAKFKEAYLHHITTNAHHPEYKEWGCIQKMPRLYLAEMVCDWQARSAEFGTSLRDWIGSVAIERYKFSFKDETFKTIEQFLDMLLEKQF